MDKIYMNLLKKIGEDVTREGLVKTPERAAKAMEFLTSGYKKNVDDVVNGAIFKADHNGWVVVKNIEFYSLCEHHILPFFGRCTVAYLPNEYIIGLSKIPRIVEIFARRLQIQERLTLEVADAIHNTIKAKGVIVTIKADHLCMKMRGVEKQEAVTVTEYVVGDLTEKDLKNYDRIKEKD